MPASNIKHSEAIGSDLSPKHTTLNFLRQFARCYSPHPSLSIPALSGSILN